MQNFETLRYNTYSL